MSGYTYSDPIPVEPCPYCGTPTCADHVDVGVGMIQCGPFHCERCGASEIGSNDKPRELTEREKEIGWYAPGAEPGSSANVIGGRIVSAEVAQAVYRAKWAENPEYENPGAVEKWRADLRAQQ